MASTVARVRDECAVDAAPVARVVGAFVARVGAEGPAVRKLADRTGIPEPTLRRLLSPQRPRSLELRTADALLTALNRVDILTVGEMQGGRWLYALAIRQHPQVSPRDKPGRPGRPCLCGGSLNGALAPAAQPSGE